MARPSFDSIWASQRYVDHNTTPRLYNDKRVISAKKGANMTTIEVLMHPIAAEVGHTSVYPLEKDVKAQVWLDLSFLGVCGP